MATKSDAERRVEHILWWVERRLQAFVEDPRWRAVAVAAWVAVAVFSLGLYWASRRPVRTPTEGATSAFEARARELPILWGLPGSVTPSRSAPTARVSPQLLDVSADRPLGAVAERGSLSPSRAGRDRWARGTSRRWR